MKRILFPGIFISIVFAILVSLGFWQLDRAKQKEAIISRITLMQNALPIFITSAADLEHKEYAKVSLEGNYIDKHLLYDNQTLNGVYGYYLISPFILKDSGEMVLVNRGFKKWDGKRTLPTIATSSPLSITVTVSSIRARPILANTIVTANNISFPLIIQSLDIKELSQILQTYIPNTLLLLQSDKKDGYIREWKPYYGISIDKHRGYALQWFMMAAVLASIAIWLLIRTRRR